MAFGPQMAFAELHKWTDIVAQKGDPEVRRSMTLEWPSLHGCGDT